MKYLSSYSKHLLILAVSFLAAVGVKAQTGALSVTKQNGKIFVSDGTNRKLVANVANNTQPLAAANHVYYINSAVADKQIIKAYDVASNTTVDVVKADALSYGAATDKKITNMVYGQTAAKLYFSTVSVNAQGYEDYLTWSLDPVTNDTKVVSDGKILSVDNTGAIQVEIHNVDARGAYTQTHVNKMNGTADVLGVRKYTTAAANASNN